MLDRVGMRCAFVAALILGMASGASAADDGIWSVSKATGEVWVATSGVQQVSLNQQEALKPGDTIRTGRNGRVLLIRGEETILISPNSVVGLPVEKKDGLSTTIIQQAGSILLEVEKRNVKHFEVETPYLAAVVKGTKFSVTVSAGSTKVGVLRGQVEVSDFKTGQIAQVMPGQAATVLEHGKPGLSLSGAGTFNPIEHGNPRASTIERVPVPKSGLSAPRNAASGHAIHALGAIDKGNKAAGAAEAIASGCRRSRRQSWRRAHLELARRGHVELPQSHARARPRRGCSRTGAQRERQHWDRDSLERYQGEHDNVQQRRHNCRNDKQWRDRRRLQLVGCERDNSLDHRRCVQRRLWLQQWKLRWQ